MIVQMKTVGSSTTSFNSEHRVGTSVTSPPIDDTVVRYAASFLVVLVAVVLGIAVAFAVPDGIAYHSQLTGLAILGGAGLGLYGMLRIEEGPGVLSRRLPSFRS